MAAGSVAERKDSNPEYELQPLLRAACKEIYPIDRRQRAGAGARATNGDILPVERVARVTVFLTMRVPGG